MSKTSRKFRVPDPLAHVYDFANTLDLRRFIQHGVRRQPADEFENAESVATWLADRDLLDRGGKLTPLMFADAMRLRASIRDYLECDPAQRHKDGDVARRLTEAIHPFPVRLQARLGVPHLVLAPARTDALAGLCLIVGELFAGAANGTLSRLKVCASDECRRVFYDRSKPMTRRWCQTALCGNRTKTRAYRERHAQ